MGSGMVVSLAEVSVDDSRQAVPKEASRRGQIELPDPDRRRRCLTELFTKHNVTAMRMG
jgi:hypothetical protein